MYYLCKKCYKPITIQYYIAYCVRQVARLTLLDSTNVLLECKLLVCRRLQSVQFSSVAKSCPTLCNPVHSSTPGLPVHHKLPEFTQTHVHQVCDAIEPYPLSSPSPPAPNPSQHQGHFQ